MADYERRSGGGRPGYNNRKRRHREDDDLDRRPQRRRYEEPLNARVKKQLLGIAESPLKKTEDEIDSIVKAISESYDDEELRNTFLDLSMQLIVEQPFKIPFVAAILLGSNAQKPELTEEILSRVGPIIQGHLELGAWREVKLVLRFLGCLQGILQGDGVFPLLEELFARAVDLQTASSEDGLGLELVKIILLTIPYVMASSAVGFETQAAALLEKTDIIASTPHTLEALVDPYPGDGGENIHEPQSVIGLLQKQLQNEAEQAWLLACVPRPWKGTGQDGERDTSGSSTKHALPSIIVPLPVSPGTRPRLPEVYFSVYADQELETVPPTSDVASSLVRDSLVDTINILDYNRNATARFLIDLDCYFAPDTFVKRATPFDRLKDVTGDLRSTWKPEDVAVDAVFSQLFQLPSPEHKQVYYHSVLTETCKIAPAAVAPSLGRAIRYLYKNIDAMDLELEDRFMDWFSHHLSNFGFTWKWTEWVDDVDLPFVQPKKAFIVGALEKEIRLSFAKRIRGTLPEPYKPLIPESKELENPPFKYDSDQEPYAHQARHLLRLIKSKAPDVEIQDVLTTVETTADSLSVPDPLVRSTDVYVTCICHLGSKTLSHALSLIERCKERLLSIGPSSEAARRQIVGSVLDYWKEKSGTGVNIVDKLLNYTILTPMSVIEWALVENLNRGEILTQSHIFEMISGTLGKVQRRVRQIVVARNQLGLDAEQKGILDETLAREREAMRQLFAVVEDALIGIAEGSADAMAEDRNADTEGVEGLRGWGLRWLRVFRRKAAVEEAWVTEMLMQGDGEVMDGVDGEEAYGEIANGIGNGVAQMAHDTS